MHMPSITPSIPVFRPTKPQKGDGLSHSWNPLNNAWNPTIKVEDFDMPTCESSTTETKGKMGRVMYEFMYAASQISTQSRPFSR